MTISIGVGRAGRTRVLRCTFGGIHLTELQDKWGQRPRMSFQAEPVDGGRWLLQLRPNEEGNIGILKRLGNRDYITYTWSLKEHELQGMAASLRRGDNVSGFSWEDGSLDVLVNGQTIRKPVERAMTSRRGEKVITTKLRKETRAMKKTAIYELERTTPGSVRYGWVSGDKGMGTLYVRKEEISGEPPKRISVTLAAVD